MDNIVKIPIKDCVVIRRGIKPLVLKRENFDGAVPYLSINSIETGVIAEYTYPELGNLTDENDILVVWDGSRSGLALLGQKGALGSTMVALTPIGLIPDYLFYFIKSKFDFINNNTTGSGIPHVDSDLFFALKIPFVSVGLQKSVVEKIKDKLDQNKVLRLQQQQIVSNLLASTNFKYTKHVDAEISLANFKYTVLEAAFKGNLTSEWRISNSNAKRQSIPGKFEVNDAFKSLNEIPKSWVWNAIGNVAECKRGRFSARPRNDPQYFGGKYPFIQIGDINHDGGIIQTHKQTLNESGIKVSKLFKAGTVVIAIVGSTIGNSGILGYDTYFTDSIVGISVNHGFDNEFVSFYLQSEKNNIQSLSYSSGGQPNLKIDYINEYPIPCPTIEEQNIIVDKIKKLLAISDEILRKYEDASNHLSDLEKAIISEGFENIISDIDREEIEHYLTTEKKNIEVNRKRLQIQQSKSKSNMKKQISATSALDIEDVLKSNGKEMLAKDVWDQSKYRGNIDAFYEALKHKNDDTINWKISNADSEVPQSVLILKKRADEN